MADLKLNSAAPSSAARASLPNPRAEGRLAVPLLPGHLEAPHASWHSFLPLILILLLGGSLACYLSSAERTREQSSILKDFDRVASDRLTLIRHTFMTSTLDLTATAAYFDNSQAVTKDDYTGFATAVLDKLLGPSRMDWIAHVPREDLDPFLEQIRREPGMEEFQIREPASFNLETPQLEPHDTHFPILYQSFQGVGEWTTTIGLDLARFPIHREALTRAAQSFLPVVSARGPMEFNGATIDAVAICQAIFPKTMDRPINPWGRPVGSPREPPIGYVSALFDIDNLATVAMSELEPEAVSLHLIDMTAPSDDRLLWSSPPGELDIEDLSPDRIAQDEWTSHDVFSIGGHRWLLVCRPLPEFIESRHTLRPAATLAGGLCLTLLLGIYLLKIQTSRRHAQHQARIFNLSQDRFASVINSADDAIVSVDSDFKILLFSSGAERMFATIADRVLGSSFGLLLPESNRSYQSESLASLASSTFTGQGASPHHRLELTALRSDGSEFPAEVSLSSFSIDGENLITAILRDTSEKKKLEAQFLQAQKMEAVGRLTGGVAHDFNNLLQVIDGYTDIIREALHKDPSRPNQADVQECLEEIAIAAERAIGLTRQLLAFSRRQNLERKYVSLNTLVDDMANMLRRVIGADINLVIRTAPILPTVHADPGQIEQAILNLAINARDAMPDGGELLITTDSVELDDHFVRDHAWASPGNHVLLSLSDTGCGIEPSDLDHLFEPFFTTKSEGKGTGLGLAMVYGTVKQHDGMISVYSELGSGTSFKIYLPTADHPEEPIRPAEVAAPTGGDETILVAEDDEMVRRLVTRILSGAGYEILSANDGVEAVDIFRESHRNIDLVLLDMVMPNLNGRETYERMHNIDPGVLVVFSSGYTAGSVHTEFFDQRDLIIIPKPYSPRQLLQKLRQLLDKAPDNPNDSTT